MFEMINRIFSLEPDYYKLPDPLFDDDMAFWKIRDTLGFFGPLILFFISIAVFITRIPYEIGYVFGFFINTVLNNYIKSSVKESRPEGGRSLFSWEIYSGTEKYGMPSLHAQSVVFSTVYLWLSGGSPSWLILESFLSALTIYQRWHYKRHTIKQLAVGSALGAGVAWGAWKLTTHYLRTQ